MYCRKCGRPMGKKNYCAYCDKDYDKRMAERKQKNKKLLWIILGCVGVAALALVLIFAIPWGGNDKTYTSSTNKHNSSDRDTVKDSEAPKDSEELIATEGKHHVAIEIQDFGTITLELDADAAPITVANFLSLAESGFYDGLTFHRIIEGFMMQGGDPEGTGMGGSDQTIKGEFASNGVQNPISHTRGTISMARSMLPDSASSQFFICHQDAPHLNGDYAAFGHVIEGMDVVDAVCAYGATVVIDGNGTVPAEKQPVIVSVKVLD